MNRWVFKEEQRDDVCAGKLCPSCLGGNIECVGIVPTLDALNMAFDCKDCNEKWEGY